MIIIKNGDVLTSSNEMICHQVNCMGVMGGGLAYQIKNKYPKIYDEYKKICDISKNKKDLLSSVQIIKIENKSQFIVNMFSQFDFGSHEVMTDYKAFETCLLNILFNCEQSNIKSIAMPYYIGCGLAGGDWDGVIYPLLKNYFDLDSPVELELWKF